ncbi:Levansucrase [Senna tora]|uniref:Levansucrase n=1 Tax=Senna tora TaxID=362788 RepID=A0A834WIC6_9FABA|nr:Levansucrase [Senna tora]
MSVAVSVGSPTHERTLSHLSVAVSVGSPTHECTLSHLSVAVSVGSPTHERTSLLAIVLPFLFQRFAILVLESASFCSSIGVPTLRGDWSCYLGFGYYKGKNCKPTCGRSSRGGVRGHTTRGGGRLRIQDLDIASPLTAPSPPITPSPPIAPSPPTVPSPPIAPSPPTAPSPPIVLSPHSSVHSNVQTDE